MELKRLTIYIYKVDKNGQAHLWIKSIKTVKLIFEFSNVWLVQCGSRESIPYIDSGGEKCSHVVVGIASQRSILLWVEISSVLIWLLNKEKEQRTKKKKEEKEQRKRNRYWKFNRGLVPISLRTTGLWRMTSYAIW